MLSIPFQDAVSSPPVPLQKPECWTPEPLCAPRVRERRLLQLSGPSVPQPLNWLSYPSSSIYLISTLILFFNRWLLFLWLSSTHYEGLHKLTPPLLQYVALICSFLFHTFYGNLIQDRNFEDVFFLHIFILNILQARIKYNFHIPTLFSYLHNRFLLFRVSFYHDVSFTFWPCWGLVSLIKQTRWRTSLCTPYVFMQPVFTTRFRSIGSVWMFGFQQPSAAVLLDRIY